MKRVILLLMFAAGYAAASGSYVYPAAGQSPEEQKRDQFECYQWAAAESGYDPVADTAVVVSEVAPAKTEPAADTGTGGAGKSALGGAAKGAVLAEVADGDAGKGAAAGATMGVLKGKREKRQQRATEEQQRAAAERARVEAAAKQRQLRANYERANAACLEGRGYTVN